MTLEDTLTELSTYLDAHPDALHDPHIIKTLVDMLTIAHLREGLLEILRHHFSKDENHA